eukprot:6626577-Pyramimonas_sp.AAC.1
MTADQWVGRASELAGERGLLADMPDTDQVDALAALIRRRARRAMIEASAAEPRARSSRPEAAPRVSKRDRILTTSAHQLRKCESKWVCLRCNMVVADAAFQSFAESPCASASPLIVEACPLAPAAVRLAAAEVHVAHRMSFFPR